MILLLIAAPVFLYLILLYLVQTGRLPEKLVARAPLLSFLAALAIAGPVLFLLARSPQWSGAAEVAWTGLETTDPRQPLILGGSRDQPVVGWPNAAFSPQVRVEPDRGLLTISRGGGFVRDARGRYLNGTVLPAGAYKPFGDFQVSYYRTLWIFGRRLAIADAQGTVVADLSLSSGRRERVAALESLVGADAIRLRKQGDAELAARLENWAVRFRLLIAPSEVRLLGQGDNPQDNPSAAISLPADLTVVWTNLRLPISVRRTADNQRLRVVFLPPFRLASPLPPPASPGDRDLRLTVTGKALPGDTAFLLPLGGDLAQFRETVPMPNGLFGTPPPATAVPKPWGPKTPAPERKEIAEVASEQKVRVQQCAAVPGQTCVAYYADLATVRDLPRPGRILAAFLIAVAVLALGLWLARPNTLPAGERAKPPRSRLLRRIVPWLAPASMRVRDCWVLGGLALALWSFLVYRFVLACRFAMDASRLDALAVSGMASAMVALVVLPGLVLLGARIRRDKVVTFVPRDGVLSGLWLMFFLLVLAAAGYAESRLAASLWPNAGRFAPELGWVDSLLLLLIWAFLAGYVFFQYLFFPKAKLRDDYLNAAEIVHRITTRIGPNLWKYVGHTVNTRDDERREDRFWGDLTILLGTGVLSLVCLVVLMSWAPSGNKMLQEVVAPLAFCWVPALVWLSSRLRFPAQSFIKREDFRWGRAAVLAVVALLAPVFLLPVVLHDAGGVVATLSVFLPLTLVLLMGRAPRRVGYLAALTLGAALTGAYFAYLNLDRLLPEMGRVGEARTRLLVFRDDSALLKYLPYFPMARDDASELPTFQSLSSGLQHTWENRALAHEGGYLGLGFGNAPTQRSQVRQDTLEFDSTFSFFVLSENGLAGGLVLLLLYAVPLVLVLTSARHHFDIGHGLATMVAGAFFLEALLHGLMNLAALPFTGRSLPLLAVNSNTDLLKWALLFWVAAQALQWRVSGLPDGYRDACSVLSGLRKIDRQGERFRHYWGGLGWLTPLFAAGFLWAAVAGVNIVRDSSFAGAFDWSDLLGKIKELSENNKLSVTADTKIELDPNEASSGGSLLEQEIARFNAQSPSERLEGSAPDVPADFRDRLKRVRTVAEYDGLLAELRRGETAGGRRRPPLFQLVEAASPGGSSGPQYRVEPNPAFNTRVSFRSAPEPGDFPSVSFRDTAAAAWVVRGSGFEFDIPDRPLQPGEQERKIYLEEGAAGALRIGQDSDKPLSPRVRLIIRLRVADATGARVQLLGDFDRVKTALVFRPGKVALKLRAAHSAASKPVNPEALVPVSAGDALLVDGRADLEPLRIYKISRGAIIGPAWYGGSWHLAYDPDPLVPWTAHYLAAVSAEWARLGKDEAAKEYGTLTLDQPIQRAAARFVSEKGRRHFGEVLKAYGGAAPPRVALAIMQVANGEVLALGGWPRMNSGQHWLIMPDGELVPPVSWVEDHAPQSLRTRYRADRNFDRLAAGSATKPFWASAVLAIHRDLDKILRVRGPAGEEQEVFGIQLSAPWHVQASGSLSGSEWTDFDSYLARSDNRYQVRLGFLGLARGDAGGPRGVGLSSSTVESLEAGQKLWERYPDFHPQIEFSYTTPSQMRDLDKTDLAGHLYAMYSIGTSLGQIEDYRASFWTGDEAHDRRIPFEGDTQPRPTALFRTISPEAPMFGLSGERYPRDFVTLLLGGGSNTWSNVDLAGAFATCVTGKPVVPHATQAAPKPDVRREQFPEIARRLRPGLRAVVENPRGTANPFLAETGALAWIRSLQGVEAYAKTGTLSLDGESGSARQISRILLALVRPGSVKEERPDRGLVFSLVVESAEMGTATRWLGEFLASNKQEMQRLLAYR